MSERLEKFTPGPWERAKNKSRGGSGKVRGLSISRVVDENGDVVAFMFPRRRQVANLHLIAAAPEMYEALKGLIDIFPKLNIEVDKPVLERTPVWRKLCHILCSADEALKKARGEE